MTHADHERAVWGSRCMSECVCARLVSLYIYMYAHMSVLLLLPHVCANISTTVAVELHSEQHNILTDQVQTD